MSNPLFKVRDCAHPARGGVHEEYARSDGSTFCRACGRELDPPKYGWIVGNSEGDKWRAWVNGMPAWVDNKRDAIQYHRREDAEAAHAEDDDAWRVVPI